MNIDIAGSHCERPGFTSRLTFGSSIALVPHDLMAPKTDDAWFGWWVTRGALEVRHHGWDEGIRRLLRAREDKDRSCAA